MRDHRENRHTFTIVLTLLMFALGLAIGMSIIHFSEVRKLKKMVKTLEESTGTTISIESGQEILHIKVPKREVKYGTIPVNSYILENFKLDEDGFMAYYDASGEKISHLGADISYHQKKIDWVKLQQTPIEFIMLRCGFRGYTQGSLIVDEKFREYADAATEIGIPIGVYFFTQALTEEEALEEADFVLDLIKDYPISYPVAIDTEYVSAADARTNLTELTKEERSKLLCVFCERIKENGYYPMVYASENWLRRNLDASMLQQYEIWAPQYLDSNDFMYDFSIWQYTERGQIDGIQGEVDLNISMVNYASFVPKLREAFLNDGKITEVTDE